MRAGRKKGSTDQVSTAQRQQLYMAYDRLVAEEKKADSHKAKFLPRAYYVDKLYDLNIGPWSRRYILYLLINRPRYDR